MTSRNNYGNLTVNLGIMHPQIILLVGFDPCITSMAEPMAWQKHKAQYPYAEPRETIHVRIRTLEQGVW